MPSQDPPLFQPTAMLRSLSIIQELTTTLGTLLILATARIHFGTTSPGCWRGPQMAMHQRKMPHACVGASRDEVTCLAGWRRDAHLQRFEANYLNQLRHDYYTQTTCKKCSETVIPIYIYVHIYTYIHCIDKYSVFRVENICAT